ncbi:Pyruvate kinase [Rasamsonia emersonii CBS 393.64]|uniref:Pyruvate kinase n=1 Tax=Rasamsonia emersonii (strain ATCC 16479 / CBS 393.64 / IMI 116815) TaxID=1408163 RepID=A0A0F4YIS3_RASE3|nr:Pyruvate kinase [Rasamsonia emersonii CBS 393.64]KKA17771.1 Pyruvate kinase [Rasamsonia emersonii CBS 393.64]
MSTPTPFDHLSNRMKLEWHSKLHTDMAPAKNYRRTSIIGTIDIVSRSQDQLGGEDQHAPPSRSECRPDELFPRFIRGSCRRLLSLPKTPSLTSLPQYHQSVIDNAREAERVQPGRPLAIALDTKGPEIRTGNTVGDKDIPIKEGHELNITTDEKYANASDDKNMYVDYKNITKVIEPGKLIYVDDGILSFTVLEIVDEKTLRVRCLNNGNISSRKGVNLPGTDVDLPALSEKDVNDLKFGVKNKVDMIFASFIRRGSDIRHIREVLGEEGKEIQIIAKIENQQGVNNFDEILEETDGVMVARGDLGIEILPPRSSSPRSLCPRPADTVEAIAMAAVGASLELNAGAILVLTTSGNTARLLSKYRPACPIIMVTRNPIASRYSHLYRGVYPFLFPEAKPDFNVKIWQEDVDRRLKWGIQQGIKLGIINRGENVVCVQGWRGGMGHTNTIRVVPAEDNLGLATS